MYGPDQPTEDPGPPHRNWRGRHRDARRLPGPLVLGLLVTALLLTFGVGATMLPTSLTGTGDAAASNPPVDVPRTLAADDAEPAPDGETPSAAPEPTGTAALGSSTAPSPKASRKPSPSPSAKPRTRATASSPAARRSTSAPAATAERDSTTAQEDEVTAIVNAERARAGCGNVRTDERLRTAARAHSQDMADNDYFSHDGRDGSRFTDRAQRAGYDRPIGENIAKGQRTPADVMNAWMNSDGHRRNILNCDARAIGVGLAFDGGTPVWTQVFGAS